VDQGGVAEVDAVVAVGAEVHDRSGGVDVVQGADGARRAEEEGGGVVAGAGIAGAAAWGFRPAVGPAVEALGKRKALNCD
jgi:hypothetical protein